MARYIISEAVARKAVRESIKSLLREDEMDVNGKLSTIVDALTKMGRIEPNVGENNLEIPLGSVVVMLSYNVEDHRYVHGMSSSEDYDDREIEGDISVEVGTIEVYDDDGGLIDQLEDNGMVEDALKSVIDLDNSTVEEYSDSDMWSEMDDLSDGPDSYYIK